MIMEKKEDVKLRGQRQWQNRVRNLEGNEGSRC
jgi:hypothetical protein